MSVCYGSVHTSGQPFLHPRWMPTLTAPNTSFVLPSGLPGYTPRNTGCAPLTSKAQYSHKTYRLGYMQPARAHTRTHRHLMPQAPATRLAGTRFETEAAPHKNFSNHGPLVKQPSRGRQEPRSPNPVKGAGQRRDSGERRARPRRNASRARASPRGRSSVYRSMTTSPRVVSSRTAMAPAAPPQQAAGVTGTARRGLRHASLSARRLFTSFFRRLRPPRRRLGPRVGCVRVVGC